MKMKNFVPDDEYVKSTRYCDLESKEIIEFCSNYKNLSALDTIEEIFNFVRDTIKYRFDYPWRYASETLKKKTGNCFNKANLQIALLRRCGIPAGYGVYLIKKEILKVLLPYDIFEMVNDPTIHVFAKVYINNRWISLDATVDKETYNTFYKKIGMWQRSNWDRKTHIQIEQEWVVEDQGLYSNIDLYLSQSPRFWTDKLIERANSFIEKNIISKMEG
ncbi:MAG TPA: transglutaminase-like domain-containing protein [Candidatus Ratteibacteria bacterium]|jgi:transglutaminase-like putative cysteine protease|uniref:Transglutaminase-like superfamily protein n=1 Tax=candidate division TA06 bacterium ADurb.Bin131 TaxID=1852827 RepID=A0A1V6CAL2_UNCT6|nr:MAG: Transglutaminase-like superfamily protein [candidate division TA06 bacterium ADurb.Bin131]HOC02375.1 transglutaminase-like domain-containing protein [bacterium]HON06377.1 transglutaminase-like domain-containing protein [bacterium]HRS05548.1 transglutaminase-like domain-containing protein [Candidatus Ratteibacteria bacterium]HRV04101.1 transglutaminase-like domain-containing protein [Candidatus Ratteibacteria bacterium]